MSEHGDMKVGLMCLNCGRIAPTLDIYWNYVFEYTGDKPIVHLVCPDCRHFGCIENITYMVVEKKEGSEHD